MALVFNVFTGNFDYVGNSAAVTGSGSTNQITYWNGSTVVAGNPKFTLDTTNNSLNLGSGADIAKLEILGNHAIAAGSFSNSVMFTFPATDTFAVIDYSIIRGSTNLRVGTLLVSNDGTNVNVIDNYSETGSTQINMASPGVGHTISGGNVQIKATSSGGSSGTLKTLVKRWG